MNNTSTGIHQGGPLSSPRPDDGEALEGARAREVQGLPGAVPWPGAGQQTHLEIQKLNFTQ